MEGLDSQSHAGEDEMRARLMIGLLSGTLLAGTSLAQAPPSQPGEIDAHIVAARTAAGQDYRATFVNL
jgi:hypothetical protein